jgi:hypothetical protein
MTPEQIIRGMLDRQRKLLKRRSKRKQTPYDGRLLEPSRARVISKRAAKRYWTKQLGKLGAASKVRHIVKDGNPVEQTR